MVTKNQLQIEFEATCMMYEHIESELNIAVIKYNCGKPLNRLQRVILAQAVWRAP